MTPLVLFVLACLTVALGCVETAFSAMLRLSLRLMAERDDSSDRLTGYLADPLSLFVPVRLLSAACLVLAALSDYREQSLNPKQWICALLGG